MKNEVESFETIFGSNWQLSWPVFPLNTDGVDVAGSNIDIRNINITNYDDAIAIKSSHSDMSVAKDGCSQDIVSENINVRHSFGLSTGSITPNLHHACVRRIKFANCNM